MVSAVSPDWLTKTHMSSLKMGERLSSRSLASSRLTGKSVRLSTVWRQARQAWNDVPHATNTMRRPRLMLLRWSLKPPRVMRRVWYGSTTWAKQKADCNADLCFSFLFQALFETYKLASFQILSTFKKPRLRTKYLFYLCMGNMRHPDKVKHQACCLLSR